MTSAKSPPNRTLDLPPENIYGHRQRLDWIQEWVEPGSTLLEVGCGTGYMLTYPLLQMGYEVLGIDLDEPSVRAGQEFLESRGWPAETVQRQGLADVDRHFDAILLSEVLEHIPGREYDALFASLRARLRDGGALLVTVPNGYGWFELESFLWYRAGVGRLLEALRIPGLLYGMKRHLPGERELEEALPATLADSPHVQRFTARSIRHLLENHGFIIEGIRGSTLVAGPFSHMFFSGFRWIMDLNKALGRRVTPIAAGFYVAARPAR